MIISSQLYEKAHGKLGNNRVYNRMGKVVVRKEGSARNLSHADKVRCAAFAMASKFAAYHKNNIRECIEPEEGLTANNTFLKINGTLLLEALNALATRKVDEGAQIQQAEIEAAVSTYAVANPMKIVIVSKPGCEKVYLTGPWPATLTIRPVGALDATVTDLRKAGATPTTPTTPSDDEPIGE